MQITHAPCWLETHRFLFPETTFLKSAEQNIKSTPGIQQGMEMTLDRSERTL